MNAGVLELRWTWMPYWLVSGPGIKDFIDELQDICILTGLTTSEADLDKLHVWVRNRLAERYTAFPGLADYLDALRHVEEPIGHPRAS